MQVAGWFESENGAEQFVVSGLNVNEAALNFVEQYGDSAVGVDREADVDEDQSIINIEYRFWAAVDRIAGRAA